MPYINPMEYNSKKIEAEYRGEQPPDTSTVEQAVSLSCNEHGGKVSVYGKGAGNMYRGGSFLMSGGRNGKDTQDAVEIDFDQETKHGRVKVAQKYSVSWIDEKKGYQEGQRETGVGLGINEDGGRVSVAGKGEGMAVMGIDEFGNGAVSTFDKYGYRQ